MGTEVAARPTLTPGLTSNSQGPGPKKRERKRSFSSSASVTSNGSSLRTIYSRDVSLRIQRRKYSLATAIVCVGAKIHHRSSPAQSLQDEKSRTHNVFRENTKLSSTTLDQLRETSFNPSFNSSDSSSFNKKPNPAVLDSHDYKSRYRCAPSDNVMTEDVIYQDTVECRVSEESQSQESQFSVSDQSTLSSDTRTEWSDNSSSEFDADFNQNFFRIDISRRGLSRGVLDEHPSLEIVTATNFTKTIADAIANYQEPLSSQQSSPTITEDAASSGQSLQGDLCATGYTTERSSVESSYSWDEFDRQAAKTVQRLFDEIDSVLFELRSNQAEHSIYKECQEWGTLFPHLRVLGRQLVPGQEVGYEMIERELTRPSTTSSMGIEEVTDQDLSLNSTDSQGLSVSGRSVRAIVPPPEARSRSSSTPSSQLSEFSFLEEEIFDCEGEYEEIIAIDYKDIYEEQSDHKKQLTPRRRRVAYPPITPNANFKDSVASSAFDCMWHEIISWMRPLLKKYSSTIFDSKPQIHSIKAEQLRNESTPAPPSRENSNMKNSLGSRAHTMIEPRQLDDLLKISRKIAIPREASTLGEIPDAQPAFPSARPVSSVPTGGARRAHSTRVPFIRNIKSSVKLAPIDRSKTPSMDEERASALRVRKIDIGVNGPITSSPTYNSRNGALPPIGTPGPLDIETGHRFQRKTVTSRASSAVDKDLRVAYRDRFIGLTDARPSTTHAFRSETPSGQGRRASTPFNSSAFNNPSISRNSYGAGMHQHLDVRGSGLQPSHDIGHLGNIPQEEDHEGLDEPVHPNQWSKVRTQYGGPPPASAPSMVYYK
ncbi:protein FAM149B1-like isoform X3 [Dreissena polymorpha]|uniref:protein FAM149B1-like isoform X3 n=1 Tax=Dreissena polymorpha TaxID=45954 RepID=UPI0022641B5A|nr:protein FAM149B1-like isoform X3 [Dreissena polymorpha]